MVISILQLCCEIYFLQIEVQFQSLSYALREWFENNKSGAMKCSRYGTENALDVTCILYPNSINILLFEIDNR